MSPQRFRRLTLTTLLTAVAFALVTLLPGCGTQDDGWSKDKPGPKIVVTFAPLYCFAVNVAGDDAQVRTLLTNSGPHHFNPTDKEVRPLRRADLFFVNGLGLEGDKPELIRKSSGNKNLKLIELGDRVPEDKRCEGACQHDHGDGGHDEHDHGKDPHLWLSPEYAVYMVEGIRDALKDADPAHAANYDTRAAEYIAKLRKLKDDGLALLKDKKDRKLVTFHDSMAYFAKTFDLNIVGVVQKNPGTEPTDKQLRTLIGLCADDKNPVRIITVEPQYGMSRSADEVRKELERKGVPDPQLVEIDPLETVTPDKLSPGWYEERMRANLEALAKAMK